MSTGSYLHALLQAEASSPAIREEMSTDCQSDLIVEDWLTVPVTRGEKSTRSIEPTKQQHHCFQHKNLCYSHCYQSHPLTQPEWILLHVNNHDPGVIPLILSARSFRSLGEQLHSTYFAAYELFVATNQKERTV